MSLKVKKQKKRKQVKRYDEAERQQLLDKYQQLRNEGKNADVAAQEIGVPYITLRTWQRNIEIRANTDADPVAIPAKGTVVLKKKTNRKKLTNNVIVLVLSNGIRVECGTPELAAQFLKANH